jgi:hypothetical protein
MDPLTKEDERAEWLTKHGWNWHPITPKPKRSKETHFRYGSIEIMRPNITVYRR